MADRWTDKYAILRDLTLAQGSAPVDIDNPISHNGKPPREINKEETEEDFYMDCMPNEDFNNGPDIGMIQDLLNAVREANVSPNFGTNNAMESELNINCGELSGPMDVNLRHNSVDEHRENTKERRNRNAAIMSLIEAYASNGNDQDSNRDGKLNLLKPNDFIHSKNDKSSVQEKVSSDKGLLSPGSMFRKKTVTVNDASTLKKKEVPTVNPKGCTNMSEAYVPSLMANEYYEKYVQQSKMKETLNEDIWMRAEKKMREIDEKREKEKQSLKSPTTTNSITSEDDITSTTSGTGGTAAVTLVSGSGDNSNTSGTSGLVKEPSC